MFIFLLLPVFRFKGACFICLNFKAGFEQDSLELIINTF